MSWLLAHAGGGYALLFAVGGVAIVLALVTDIVARRLHPAA